MIPPISLFSRIIWCNLEWTEYCKQLGSVPVVPTDTIDKVCADRIFTEYIGILNAALCYIQYYASVNTFRILF